MMDLTTLARVKEFIGFDGDSSDSTLEQLITEVSAQCEREMRRTVQTGTPTEYFDVNTQQKTHFYLKAWPVTIITTVKHDTSRAWADSSLIDDSNYTFDPEQGILIVDGTSLSSGYRCLQVVYAGGMAATAAAFVAAYPDIALAVEAQVAFVFSRRTTIAQSAVSHSGGSMSFAPRFELIADVKHTLEAHRRKIYGR